MPKNVFEAIYFNFVNNVEKPVETQTSLNSQLALWLERLTPDQEDITGTELGALNRRWKFLLSSGLSTNGDPDMIM